MYESVLSATCQVLRQLPTPVPETGKLAGICGRHPVEHEEMFRGDYYHTPMGTAFLQLGVPGVAQRAAASAKKVGTPEQKELLESISAAYQEIAAYFARYAEAVEAAANGDPRLVHMAGMLHTLSTARPSHFDEALQLMYLMWDIRCLNCDGADIGRLDVYLREWFEADIASGYTTEEQVLELLCDFWNMLNRHASGDTLINVMVGGRNQDGSDAASRLSVLMLKATQRCKQSEPHINVRVHPGLRKDVYRAMLEVQLMGQGQATMYNDEVVIPSLIRFGIPEELACCYANDGCTEIVIDGYSSIDFAHVDAVGAFELAFNNGDWAPRTYRQPIKYWTWKQNGNYYTPDAVPGFASGRPEDCETFEEFYQQFLRQFQFQFRNKASTLRRKEEDRAAGAVTSVFLNGTFDYILDSGLDCIRSGFPIKAYMMFSGSITTVADCLVAVKNLVFEQKKYTIAEIKEAIRVNFEGYELMRRQMAAAPKFGNDLDEVDLIAADLALHYCNWLEDYRKETGFAIMPALLGWRFLEEAYGVAATPDGRRYGDPIAEHFCATPGKAVKGPTALLRSISKAKKAIDKACGVCAVHVSLPSNLGSDEEESLAVLDSLLSAGIAGGLNQMNIAIYDADLLRRAKKDPENHKDVIVRVWGYSARFVDLCDEMQDHVIARVSQAN